LREEQTLIEKTITATLEEYYMPYSAYVILQRAIPQIDGFKPSQRRILYTMYKMGLTHNINRRKSQGVVGQTMFLHPHGDMAIYDTLVRMTKDNGAFLIPYIDSKGNLGKVYSTDMQCASARYTEVRLMPIAQELFKDINKNAVEMIDNYDNTMKEPLLLPVTFPTILANPSSGTAVGMSSSIPSFNLKEIIDFTIAYLKDPNVRVIDYIKIPDFSTGGVVVFDEKEFEKIYETGRGSIKIRAKYHFEDNSIIIDEIPYTTTIEAIISKITDLIKNGKIKEITDINDIEGINSKGIEITVKNNTNKELLMNKLFKFTPLEDTFTCNFNIIIDGKPQTLGIKQIIREWLKFRANCIKRSRQFELDKKMRERHLLLAFKKVILDIDKAIEIIKDSKDNEVIPRLIEHFGVDEEQAEFIAEIKLRNLNKEYMIKKINRIDILTPEIEQLQELITNKVKLAKYIINELEEVKKKYGQERRTQLIMKNEIELFNNKEIEIENYNVRLFVTKQGYLKKIPSVSLRGAFNIKLKDDDEIVDEIDATNKSDILIFTDKQNCYKLKAYEIDDHKPSVLGEYLPSTLGLKDENIVYVTATEDYEGYLIIGFENGKVAKIDLKAYETKTNRSMLKNAYTDQEKPIYFDTIKNDIDLVAVSTINKVLVFNTSMINTKSSKTTIGVQVMKSKNDSKVKMIKRLENVQLQDVDYYRTSSAAVGKYLKKGNIIE
jgi:DNA gyrase subunit A